MDDLNRIKQDSPPSSFAAPIPSPPPLSTVVLSQILFMVIWWFTGLFSSWKSIAVHCIVAPIAFLILFILDGPHSHILLLLPPSFPSSLSSIFLSSLSSIPTTRHKTRCCNCDVDGSGRCRIRDKPRLPRRLLPSAPRALRYFSFASSSLFVSSFKYFSPPQAFRCGWFGYIWRPLSPWGTSRDGSAPPPPPINRTQTELKIRIIRKVVIVSIFSHRRVSRTRGDSQRPNPSSTD